MDDILKPVFGDIAIVIPRCDGTERLVDLKTSGSMFCYVQNLSIESQKTDDTLVKIYTLKGVLALGKIYGDEFEALSLTDSQVKIFIEKYSRHIGPKGVTHFLLCSRGQPMLIKAIQQSKGEIDIKFCNFDPKEKIAGILNAQLVIPIH